MRTRALSPVLGFLVLVGLSAVAALLMFAAGGLAVDDAQSNAETRLAQQSMESVSTTANRLVAGETDQDSVALANDRAAATEVDGDAGEVEVVLVDSGSTETLIEADLGVYRYELDDGTEIAHQGGGVWRHRDGHTTLVTPPAFDYRGGDEPTLNFDVHRVGAAPTDNGTREATLRVAERTEVFPSDAANPVEGTSLYVDVQSRYCEGWEEHVRRNTDGSLEEHCEESGATSAPDQLRVNLTVPSEDATFSHETIGLYGEEIISAADASLTVNATLGAGEEIDLENASLDHEGQLADGVPAQREPHDEEIRDLVDGANSSDWESLCDDEYDYSCTYEGNQTVYVDEFHNGSAEVDYDLSDGNLTMVVDDDILFADYTKWTVQNHGDGERGVKVYTTGNVTFGDGSIQLGDDGGPDSVQPIQDPEKAEQFAPEALQFYGTSNMRMRIDESNPKVAATLSAPSHGTDNQSKTVVQGSSSTIEWIGSIYLGEINLTELDLSLYQPSQTGAGKVRELEAYGGGTVELYYLHLTDILLEVEE